MVEIMANLGMGNEYYTFSKEEIEKVIKQENTIGNYCLGTLKDKVIVPKYVGRSDECVKTRLLQHALDQEKLKKYSIFKYCYQDNVKNAYHMECKNYHDFEKQLDNKIHPDQPKGKSYTCPSTGCSSK